VTVNVVESIQSAGLVKRNDISQATIEETSLPTVVSLYRHQPSILKRSQQRNNPPKRYKNGVSMITNSGRS
jgi:hypothetical protein